MMKRSNEQKYRSIIENSPDIITRYSPEGRRIYANQHFERLSRLSLLQITANEVEGSTDNTDDKGWKKFNSLINWVLHEKKDIGFEISGTADKGNVCYYYVTLIPELNANQKLIGVIGYFQDITSVKQGIVAQSDIYDPVFNFSNDAIQLIDSNARLVYVNRQTSQLLGYTRDELLGMTVTDINPGVKKDDIRLFLHTLKAQNKPKVSVLGLRDKSGGIIPFEVSLSLFNHHSRPLILAVCRDLRNINKYKDFLLMSNFTLDLVDTPVLINNSKGFFIYVNKKACQLLGYRREELLAMNISNIVSSIDSEALKLIHKCVTERHSPLIKHRAKHTDKNGSTFHVELTTNIYAEKDKFYTVSFIRDITNQIELDELLVRTEQDFMILVEDAPDIIIRFDSSLRCVFVNRAFEKLTGYLQFDMLDKTLVQNDSMPLHIAYKLEKILKQVQRTKKGINQKFAIPNAQTGKMVHLLVDIIADKKSTSKKNGIMLVARDVTELKEYEEKLIIEKERAEESSRLKSAFLAIISHELRTPVNAIVGFSNLLTDDSITGEERSDFTGLMEMSVSKLTQMVDDIIDLSKMISGNIKLFPVEYNPVTLVREHYLELENKCQMLGKEGIRLKVRINKKLEEKMLFGDVSKIRKVLSILIDNALKFTDQGEISISLGVKGEKHIVYKVSDTGIGIPKEKQKDIFEPFTTLHSTMSRTYNGVGIGLALAYKIVQAMGGELSLVSSIDSGSTFSVIVPVDYSGSIPET